MESGRSITLRISQLAFWALLQVGYVPSYCFNQSGFYFGGILRLVHAVTDLATGSKAVTYLAPSN